MTTVSIEIPSQDALVHLSTSEKIDIVQQALSVQEQVLPIIISLIEEALYPVIKDMTHVNEINLDPNYQYNDEGYAHSYVMPFINGEYDSWKFSEEAEKIDLALKNLAHFIPRDDDGLTIDADELRSRFNGGQAKLSNSIKKSRFNVEK